MAMVKRYEGFGFELGVENVSLRREDVQAYHACISFIDAHIGLILTAPPYDDPEISHLALRILTRWLISSFGVHRLETSVPAHLAAVIGFWESAGFAFTGEQFRRDLPGYFPRLLVLAKDLPPPP